MPIARIIPPVATGNVPIKVWTDDIEASAEQQLLNLASMPFIHKHVAAMPDVHWGQGATVGSVLACKRAVIPAAVGVDIGCLDAETEFLSPTGWVRMDKWKNHEVLQYDLFRDVASFVKPHTHIRRKNSKGFYKLKHARGLDQLVSEDHRVLFYSGTRSRGFAPKTFFARDLVEQQSKLKKPMGGGFRTTFAVDHPPLNLSDSEIRVVMMIQADGCLRSKELVELHLRKERKIERAEMLLAEADIKFKKATQKDGSTRITFKTPIATKSLALFWSASQAQLEILCDEVLRWDGHAASSAKDHSAYSTTDKENADIVQFAFATQGIRAGIHEVTHTSPDRANWNPNYSVYLTKNPYVGMIDASGIEMVPSEDGYEYCFAVPSGYFIARRNNKVFITGNCGMMAVKTNLNAFDLPDSLRILRTAIERSVPVGFKTHKDMPRSKTGQPLADLARIHRGFEPIIQKHPKIKWKGPSGLSAQLGTLGGGNHFIEVCLDLEGNVWVMLHSGSRNIGKVIADYFISRAKELMERYHIDLPDRDLAFFPEGEQEFDDYCEAVEWAQNYALANREAMMKIVLFEVQHYFPKMIVVDGGTNCHHNYVSRENHFGANVIVTRKGAIAARSGQLGIIPGSMGTHSYIVRGRGNADSFHSCSHGAGRRMSRKQAQRQFTAVDLVAQTRGVECRKDEGVVDEIPAAYKDIDVVMANQSDLVEVVAELRQVLCVKG